MRDNYLDSYHREQRSQQNLALPTPDSDEVQPLLFDLVQTDNVDAVRCLLPSFKALTYDVRFQLLKLAASSGSPRLIDLLWNKTDGYETRQVLASAAMSQNTGTLEHLCQKNFILKAYEILGSVLRSGSMEVYKIWEKRITAELNTLIEPDISFKLEEELRVQLGNSLIDKIHLSAIEGNPQRDQLVLNLWKNQDIAKILKSSARLGDALVTVAQSCYSVKLANYLIEAGADVNHRRSTKYLTPLHHAVTKDSAEAATFAKFLLFHGADPELDRAGNSASERPRDKQRIRDEKGAKGIAKWLGVSWDELIAQARKEREEVKGKADFNSETRDNNE